MTMKLLIAYASKYGCTQECARQINERLQGQGQLVDLCQQPKIDPTTYDAVLVGGSVYAGAVRKEVRNFCKENQQALLEKRVGIFLSCASPDGDYFTPNFSPELVKHAEGKALVGGRIDMAKMNGFERLIIKMISKSQGGMNPEINLEAIEAFAAIFQN